MDCSEFKENHAAFMDDTLPAVDMVAAQRHLLECNGCSRDDTRVRRALLVFRNLPTIQPSADFNERLNRRILEAGPLPLDVPRYRGPGLGVFAAAAVGIVALGYAATSVVQGGSTPQLNLAPVVATLPEPMASPLASPAIAASMTTGMPVWPAMLMAEQASLHFVSAEFQLAGWSH